MEDRNLRESLGLTSSDEEDEEIPGMDEMKCKCLWCEMIFSTHEAVFAHCVSEHHFFMTDFIINNITDEYDYIKFINFTRATKTDAATLQELAPSVWKDDKYLIPTDVEDSLLTFDLDIILENVSELTLNGDVNMRNQLLETQDRLKEAVDSMEQMKKTAQLLFASGGDDLALCSSTVANLQEDDDNAYFGSYGHFSIHQDMLKDRARTEFYQRCIESNAALIKDAVVLDVGCGTGILSLMAVKHGAKRVIAVDMSEVVYQAMDIARENDMDERITFLKGRVEDVSLPVDKVDIIISEWMGYFLLFESMLDSVLWSRDHYLRPGGILIPNHCSMYLAAASDPEIRRENLDFWTDVYGFKMSCMKTGVLQEASVARVLPEHIVSKPETIKDLDLMTCKTSDLDFASNFSLTITKPCTVTALVGYFDVRLQNVEHEDVLTTSPDSTSTHWKQTVFMLEDTMDLKQGEVLNGTLTCRKNYKDLRSLIVKIKLGSKSQSFHIQ